MILIIDYIIEIFKSVVQSTWHAVFCWPRNVKTWANVSNWIPVFRPPPFHNNSSTEPVICNGNSLFAHLYRLSCSFIAVLPQIGKWPAYNFGIESHDAAVFGTYGPLHPLQSPLRRLWYELGWEGHVTYHLNSDGLPGAVYCTSWLLTPRLD